MAIAWRTIHCDCLAKYPAVWKKQFPPPSIATWSWVSCFTDSPQRWSSPQLISSPSVPPSGLGLWASVWAGSHRAAIAASTCVPAVGLAALNQ